MQVSWPVRRRDQTLSSVGPSWEAMQVARTGRNGVCVPTLQPTAPFQMLDTRTDIKITQYSNNVNTNRSRLVRGLESTEAMRAVSLSALA